MAERLKNKSAFVRGIVRRPGASGFSIFLILVLLFDLALRPAVSFAQPRDTISFSAELTTVTVRILQFRGRWIFRLVCLARPRAALHFGMSVTRVQRSRRDS